MRSHSNRTVENSAGYLAAEFNSGAHVLDVGSGPGTITADIARMVDPGSVVAVEMTSEAAALTRAELDRQRLTNARAVVGDALALDFGDGTFDVVHAHQVLQHVPDPVLALHEMMRVCRPGGVVGVRDSDYASFAWYPRVPELDEWLSLYRAAARANGGEPDAGRRLLAWAHAAGAATVEATSSTWCYATPEAREWWGGMWADRIVESDLAEQLVREQRATRADLDRISEGWRQWARDPDGWFSLLHGELLIRV
ncbi:class I SAM-dependent methyltransferase [Spelaeicoccus albus]|uniref:class I SAM-dependent methyltransferase n=1 Tax=Spelaeicoccus albus TaxID=1280376 RepID=UPI001F33BBAE|nr:class I SAM-dependent methyltransferase [Spelaeicoccus albus]